MKVLHVIGDRRVSGPAAAALALARALAAAGVEARLQCVPGGALASAAEGEGILSGVGLPGNYGSLFATGAMRRAVGAAAEELGAEIIHVHRSPEHIAAGRVRGSDGPSVVRSWHCGGPALPPFFTRWLMRWRTAGVVTPSERAAEVLGGWLPGARVAAMPGIVDADVFRPRTDEALRAGMGAAAGDVLIGAVGRFARERMLDRFIVAFGEAEQPEGVCVRGVILGRGPQRAELERMAGDIVPDGRLRVVETSDDFPSQLGALDVGVQVAPGSDGTCRTALEMMASSLAVVVGSRGALSQIVSDGETGRVVDPVARGELASALSGLASSETLRRELGEAAREKVLERNSAGVVAGRCAGFYRKILEGRS